MKRIKDNKHLLMTICGLLMLLVLAGGVTFAIFSYNSESGDNNLNSGYITMTYTEPSNEYVVENALPIKDEEAKYDSNYFEFSVTTNAKVEKNNVTLPYEITITETEGNTLASNQIKMYLTEVEGEKELINLEPTLVSNLEPSIYKSEGTKIGFNLHMHTNEKETITTKFRLRAWVDYNVDVSNWDTAGAFQYKFRVNVNGTANYQGYYTDQSCFMYQNHITDDSEYAIITGYDFDNCDTSTIVVPENFYEEIKSKPITAVNLISEEEYIVIYRQQMFEEQCDGYATQAECIAGLGGTEEYVNSLASNEYIKIKNQIGDTSLYIGQNYYDYEEDIKATGLVESGILTVETGPEETTTKEIPVVIIIINNDEKKDITIDSLILPALPASEGIYAGSFEEVKINKLMDSNGNFPLSCLNTSENGDGVAISSYKCKGVENVKIPATINNKAVTAISNSAFYEKGIKSVTIPDTVTKIGDSAFKYNEITNVIIPENVTQIGDSAFANNKLTSIDIPNSIETIPSYAFANNNIKSVTIPNNVRTIQNNAFENSNLENVQFNEGLTTIEDYAFENNRLTKINIPSSVLTIKSCAFENNRLEAVMLPSTTTLSDSTIFYGNKIVKLVNENNQLAKQCLFFSSDKTTITGFICRGLIELDLPSSYDNVTITTIGERAFSQQGLEKVILPDTITTINKQGFEGNKIKEVKLSEKLTTIDVFAFQDNKLKRIELPDSVTTISNYSFTHNALEEVILPKNLISIGNGAFSNNNITKINLPNTLTSMGGSAFENNKLEKVIIPSSLTTTGSSAFKNNLIRELIISEGVTSIGQYVFSGNKLKSINLPEGLLEIGAFAFNENDFTEVTIPSTVTKIGMAAFYKTDTSNTRLAKIINKTNRGFDWESIVLKSSFMPYKAGTIQHKLGNVEIVLG